MSDVLIEKIFGAIRFVDAVTGRRIEGNLRVAAAGLGFRRNRSGDYVIMTATGVPVNGTRRFSVTVEDPRGYFHPASVLVDLPRQSDPNRATEEGSIFRPVIAPLYSTQARPLESNWCVVRVTALRAADDRPLAGAGLRLVRADDTARVHYNTVGPSGESILPIEGLPFFFVAAQAEAEVVSTKTSGTLQLFLHQDGEPVTPDMMKANNPKLVEKGNATVDLAAASSIHQLFKVNP
jgi:hypothetical protein